MLDIINAINNNTERIIVSWSMNADETHGSIQ